MDWMDGEKQENARKLVEFRKNGENWLKNVVKIGKKGKNGKKGRKSMEGADGGVGFPVGVFFKELGGDGGENGAKMWEMGGFLGNWG